MKQKKNKAKLFGWMAFSVFGIGLVIAVLGLSNAVKEIEDVSVSKTPSAILASAGVDDSELVTLPVLYYDQKADDCVNLYDLNLRDALNARQFEWESCGYHNKGIEQGLVGFELDDKYMPVAFKGKLTSNKGINFDRWFSNVDGKSNSYAGNLQMRYVADGAEFSFVAEDFYPLDEADFGKGEKVNEDGHNHLFTMNFAVPFTVLGSGEEEFVVTADDDTFVFVGNQLAIDMGGVHEAITGRFVIRENGEVYAGVDGEELAYSGIRVSDGTGSIIRIFHADRDSSESTFDMKFSGMNLSVTNAEVAEGGGIQIAYDPSDLSYIPPLGESMVFTPDSTEGLVIMATIEGVMIVMVSVLAVMVARFMVRQKIEG